MLCNLQQKIVAQHRFWAVILLAVAWLSAGHAGAQEDLEVVHVHPSGTVVTPVYEIIVGFSESVQSGTFGPEDIILGGPHGVIPVRRVMDWGMGMFNLTALYLADGDYVLMIGPDVTGVSGATMAAVSTNTFRVDTTPPTSPTLTNYLPPPETNFVDRFTIELQGTRDSTGPSSVWIDGTEAVPLGWGAWSATITLTGGVNEVEFFAKDDLDRISPAVGYLFDPSGTRDVVLTGTNTITATDAAYDGKTIIVDGGLLIIDGSHTFKSLTLTNGAIMKHSIAVTGLTITVTNDMYISTNSAIDLSARGYGSTKALPGDGPGGGGNVKWTQTGGGGGHGGRGGTGSTDAPGGDAYGSVTAPVTLGSGGGGTGSVRGGYGGGAMRLDVKGTLRVDGAIRSNGEAGLGTPAYPSGGGAGGSLWIGGGRLEGTTNGAIAANGGDGLFSIGFTSGAGGGGRISIEYGVNEFLGSVAASGGSDRHGGAGTVYLRDTNDTLGILLVDNGGQLDCPATPIFDQYHMSNVVVSGAGQIEITADGALTVDNLVLLTDSGSFTMSSPAAQLLGAPDLVVTNGTSAVSIHSEIPLTQPRFSSVTVASGVTLTHLGLQQTHDYSLMLSVTGDMTVGTGAVISVTGRGYASIGANAGYGPGGGSYHASAGAGGGYGGRGGSSTAKAPGGRSYGWALVPTDLGSAGSGAAEVRGGFGGGAVRLEVGGTLRLDGGIYADGEAGPWHGSRPGGGGAGGSVWLLASQLQAGAEVAITADGGDGFEPTGNVSGGGGGGRIAIYAPSLDINTNLLSVAGGASIHENGSPGTIHIGGAMPAYVSSVLPTGYTNGAFDAFAVTFTTPVAPATFTVSDVTLTGPSGTTVPSSVTASGAFAFDILFSPAIAQDGLYTLAIGPNVSSVYGGAMDADRDGNPGEPGDDAYRSSLILDATPPSVVLKISTSAYVGIDVTCDAGASTDAFEIVSYTWDFGDGQIEDAGPVPYHQYSAPGTYTVTVDVCDMAGNIGRATTEVTVVDEALVLAVPWQLIGDTEICHQTWSSNEVTLKAVAAHMPLPVEYSWDFGDGSPVETGAVTTAEEAYRIEAHHVYTGAVDTVYTAIVSIVDGQGREASDTYPIQICSSNLQTAMDAAIDNGLWYLHKNMHRTVLGDGTPAGYWDYDRYPGKFIWGPTASGLHALKIHGRLETGDAMRDPYVETVRRGMSYLLASLEPTDIAPQSYGIADGNGNGKGISLGFAQASHVGYPPYEAGQIMDALAVGSRKDMVAQSGAVGVAGRTYADLMQDMIDQYAWGQSDLSWGGGWRYGWNVADADNSASQWGAIGMLAAEQLFDLSAPQWLKDRNLVWLQYTYRPNGFIYAHTDQQFTGSGGPSVLVQLSWAGVTTNSALWQTAEQAMVAQWTTTDIYFRYSSAKALLLARPEPVRMLSSGIDWFWDESAGLARRLVDEQEDDGSWTDTGSWVTDPGFAAAWSLIILSESVFNLRPQADLVVTPPSATIGQIVVCDGRGSRHPDPSSEIVQYLWDFDASDGVDFENPDAVGHVATNKYLVPGTYTITLKVVDDATPALSDTAAAEVEITSPSHPPTADASGPYVAAAGETIHLDGSGSFDIDIALGDAVRAWDWELDGLEPHDFDDWISGRNPLFRGGFSTAGTRSIGLRVADSTSILFPGAPDLTDDDFTEVVVYERVADDLQARAKHTKCQLTWTKVGDEAAIMRSTNGPHIGFIEIGRTTSDYATYLDSPISTNVDYCYRIYAYETGNTNPLGISPAVYSAAVIRDANRRPRFTSTPLPATRVGLAYSYDAEADDAENDPLTFALVQGPEGMTIDTNSGLVEFTAATNQLGAHPITLHVLDAHGKDVQTYDLVVFTASNQLPVAEANGPYTGLISQAISFSSAGTHDPDGGALKYSWNFGDGGTSSDPNPTHTYSAAGDYVVVLAVNDGQGGTAIDTARALIKRPNADPVALIRDGPLFQRRAGQTLTLDASESSDPDGDPLSYEWTWRTGVVQTAGEIASHTYTNQGSFNGKVTVSDGRGGSAEAPFSVTVFPPNNPPVAAFTVTSADTNIGDVFTFDAGPSSDLDGDTLAYHWDTGDGRVVTEESFTHAYTATGEYSVVLTVDDGYGGTSQTSKVIGVGHTRPAIISTPKTGAAAGAQYVYQVVARDPENDPITYSLDVSPAGMTISNTTGRIEWTPTAGQVGNQAVTVRATDDHATFGTQTFTITVVAEPRPPVADAGADAEGTVGTAVHLSGSGSIDPDSSELTYGWTLQVAPVGSTAQLQDMTNVVASFTPDRAGSYVISLVVSDGTHESAPDTVTVTVTDPDANVPPLFTSEPPVDGMVGQQYEYQPAVTDGNDDTLSYGLAEAPAGMAVDPDAGTVTWTPAQTGQYTVVIVVEDGRGGEAVQAYTLTVVPYQNLAPVITSTPVAVAAPEALYSYDVEANDPNSHTLTYSFDVSPAGMTIDGNSGQIEWTPAPADAGGHDVSVVANDGQGGTATQSFSVAVIVATPDSPVLSTIPDQTVVDPAAFVQIPLDNFVADLVYPDSQITWQTAGHTILSIAIDANRIATITYAPGARAREEIMFVAQNPNGDSAFTTATFIVRGADVDPVAAFASLSATETTLVRDGLFDLKGTADDPDHPIDDVAYQIRLYSPDGLLVKDLTPAPVDADGWHEGRVAAGGSLGELDFTMTENGVYDLYLDVRGGNKTASASARIALDSQLKVGQFSFSQQDVTIPVSGIPLTVIRTYNSLNKEEGEFGYSWTYSIADINFKVDEVRGTEHDVYTFQPFSIRTGGGRNVTLTMPNTGQRVTFRYSLTHAHTSGALAYYKANWTAPPGVNATLEPTCSPYLVVLAATWGEPLVYWEESGPLPSRENFDFPGYVLTTYDGTQYRIERKSHGEHLLGVGQAVTPYSGGTLKRINTRAGDRLEFVRSAELVQRVDHFDAYDYKTKSLTLERDAHDRITAIYDPAALDEDDQPIGPAAMKYDYDERGNLVRAHKLTDVSDESDPSDATYETIEYVYGHEEFPHYITEIKDPRGISPMRTEYDDEGRIVATIDANGNRIELDHNLAARTETIRDREGNATVHVYDKRGNVIASTDALGNTVRRTYDDNGNELTVTDPLGNTTTNEYDAAGNLLKTTSPVGQSSSYTYDSHGNQLTATDSLGNTTTNVYDGKGNLTATINALGQRSENVYDGRGQLTAIKDVLGNVTASLGYDGAGNMTAMTDASGVTRSFSYDRSGNQTGTGFQWVNPDDTNEIRTVTTATEYDSAGRVVRTTDPDGNQTITEYNAIGKPFRVFQILPLTINHQPSTITNVTRHLYDARGNEIETRYPDGTITRTVYDANARPVVTVDRFPGGTGAVPSAVNGTRTVYDAVGRVIRTERLSDVVINIVSAELGTRSSEFGSAGGVLSATATTYDAAGRVLSTRTIESSESIGETFYEYDAAGRNTAIIDAVSNRTEFVYDALGRQASTILAAGTPSATTNHFEYDALGRRVRTIFADGTFTETAYDELGRRIAETDQTGKTRGFEYDDLGRLTATVLNATTNLEALTARYSFSYTQYGALAAITDPLNRVTRFAYDERNRQLSRTLPMGQTETQAYDSLGRLGYKLDFKGQATEFVYDTLGRVIEKNLYSTAGIPACGPLDATGDLQTDYPDVGAPDATVSYSYDTLGRLTNVVQSMELGVRSMEYAYDSEGRITSVVTPEGIINYEYDALGRRTRTYTDGGTDTRYTYDSLNRLATVSRVDAGTTNTTRYTYNAIGSRDSMILPNGITTQYGYSKLNRLTQLTHVNAAAEVLGSYAYTLAPDGRRIGVLESFRNPVNPVDPVKTNSVTYTYDDLNRLIKETATAENGTGYSSDYVYDAVGNRLLRTVNANGQILQTSYTYNDNDQLLSESNSVTVAQIPVGYTTIASTATSGDPLLGGVAAGRGGSPTVIYRNVPGPIWSYAFKTIPVLLILALVLPIFVPFGVFRGYTSSRIPAFYRGVAAVLALMFFIGFSALDTIAQEAELYDQVTTATWGNDGQVTNYAYDANGSLVLKVTTRNGTQTTEHFDYNLENRLSRHTKTIVRDTGSTVSVTDYTYNHEGIKVKSETTVTVDGVPQPDLEEIQIFLVDSYNHTGYSQIVETRTEYGGAPTVSYTIGDDVLSQVKGGGAPEYLLYDGHGSTRQLADATGGITAQYTYDAYGVMLGQQAGSQEKQATSLLYCGEQFDSGLQNYYLRARHYDQSNGRFNRLDPFAGNHHDPQSLHKYAYAHGDPVNGVDPSGEFSKVELLIASGISALLSGLTTFAYLKWVKNYDTWSALLGGLASAAVAFLAVYFAPQLAAILAKVAAHGLLGSLAVYGFAGYVATALVSAIAWLAGEAFSGAYSPMQRVIILSRIGSILLTCVLAWAAVKTGSEPVFKIKAESNHGNIEITGHRPTASPKPTNIDRVSPATIKGRTPDGTPYWAPEHVPNGTLVAPVYNSQGELVGYTIIGSVGKGAAISNLGQG